MKAALCLLLACILYSCRPAVPPPLFRIISQDKIGYIDSSGKIVIAPAFLAAGAFSEGMAEARVTGTYGYIGVTGQFVIPPQFDYATPFSEGLAVVYKDGIPFYISRKGERAFAVGYKTLSPFSHGRAQVFTTGGKTGFINHQGQLIIDTVFKEIRPFVNGYAVVEGPGHEPYAKDSVEVNYEVGIIDSTGHFLVPYGGYREISDQSGGYFGVDLLAGAADGSTTSGFLDAKGKLVLTEDKQRVDYFSGNVSNGLIKVVLRNDGKGNNVAFLDISGKIVLHDTSYQDINSFSDNRSIARKGTKQFIIDLSGRQVTDQQFDDVEGDGFNHGVAIVEIQEKWGLIDTSGHFLIPPKYDRLDAAGGDYYFFQEERAFRSLRGIVGKDGQVIFPARLESIRGAFENGLLLGSIQGRYAYINKEGKVVWQQQKDSSLRLTDLNVDYRLPGYFSAFSMENMLERGFAPHYSELDNYPCLVSGANAFPVQVFGIQVGAAVTDTFEMIYKGRRVEVFNTTADTIHFDAQDSRLYMKTQAMDQQGRWQDIEYLPGSGCGNSYHRLSLPSGQYWQFTAPVYAGDMPVKMRIVLSWVRDWNGSREPAVVYSPIFDGKVNPAQFWRKPELRANNIMDPTIY